VHVICIKPACPLGIVDDSDEFHQELAENGQQVVSRRMAMMIESMLIQRLKKSKMEVILPRQAIEVFAWL
jgi:hypothetical protein